MDSADLIAPVVADLTAGRAMNAGDRVGTQIYLNGYKKLGGLGPVVDCTDIYQHLVQNDRAIAAYDDHPCIAPPWERAVFAHVTRAGIVVLAQMEVVERPADDEMDENWESSVAWFDMAREFNLEDRPAAWDTPADVAWDDVRWIAECAVWIGARGPTCGPIIRWRYAIYDDGTPADLTWSHCGLDETDVRLRPPEPETSSLVPLEALNLLNCNNVEIVDYQPTSRAQRRRLERSGVRTSVVRVFPPGARRRSDSQGQPLGAGYHGVRGHFARYGTKFNRGLLFGKYEGRFYIPQHARGSADRGEINQSYELHPESRQPSDDKHE